MDWDAIGAVIDGMFSEDPEGSVQFHEATHLTASDWGELQHTIRHRVLRYFHGAPTEGGSRSARTPRHRRHAHLASLRRVQHRCLGPHPGP